jgi:hypothetical protein
LEHRVSLQQFFVPDQPSSHRRLCCPLTGAGLDSRDIVGGHVIFYPGPVQVAVSLGSLVGVQLLGDGAVPEEAGCNGDLEAQPVLGLADVEDVPLLSVSHEPANDGCRGIDYLVYAVQAVGVSVASAVGYGRRQGGLPVFSSVFSISSLEIPKPSQYPMCSSISLKMCVTMAADCPSAVLRSLVYRVVKNGRPTAAMSFIELALYDPSAFARAKCICSG